jgi:ribA/ribD-fused uncharacterized protein
VIIHFQGTAHRFLSNFFPVYGTTVEHLYQAEKTLDLELRQRILALPASEAFTARKLGRDLVLRPDWEEIKRDVMLGLLRWKFAPGTDLAKMLLATGEQMLIEGNWWHDNYWGTCGCMRCGNKGKNVLGELLMQVRDEARKG